VNDGDTKAEGVYCVYCSDVGGCCLSFLIKNSIMPTAMSATAADPIAMPAIAPPPSLLVLVTAAADVELCTEDVADVKGVEVEDDEVFGEEGAEVD
jgi:hypothetical protein